MTPETLLERERGIVERRIAGETILVPIRQRVQEMGLFTLNEVGTFVWERLDGTLTLGEIGERVALEFAVGLERAGRDVLAFGDSLVGAACAREVTA